MLSTTLMRTQQLLNQAGLSATFFAMAAGVAPATFTAVLRCTRRLDGQEEQSLYEAAKRAVEVVEAAKPFAIGDWFVLRDLMECGRSGEEIHHMVTEIFKQAGGAEK